MTRTSVVLLFALYAFATPAFSQDERAPADGQEAAAASPPAEKLPSPEELEKRFAETLSGATLVGHFTTSGREGQPKEERYTISRVTKQQGDTWLFLARMQFGGRDLTVPMFIPVKWAGDTAVISVTDLGIPGMGTYTARVVIHGDQYAGTWSGKDHGGHLWGRIERTAESGAEAKPAGEPSSNAPPNASSKTQGKTPATGAGGAANEADKPKAGAQGQP